MMTTGLRSLCQLFGLLLFAGAVGRLGAQEQRGFAPEQKDTGTVIQGHRYVVAIGVNDYANWPKLTTAVNDAVGFADLLHTQFGYELAAPPLTEKNATRQAIEALLDDDLRAKLKPDDDLVIFFAGHGTTRNDAVGGQVSKVGFLVPYDAHASGMGERWSDYIKVGEFLRTVSDLPARHILVILDSCHSGLALGAGFSSSRGIEHLTGDMTRKMSRKVIASAEGDQLAADQGPLPNHSLFTGLMMQGLTTGRADNFGQGFVTSTQLGAFAQHEVSVANGSKQTPIFGTFEGDAAGELLLPTSGDFQSLFQRAADALTREDTDAFGQFAQKAISLSADTPRGLWLKYEIALHAGDIDGAVADLRELDDAMNGHGRLPGDLLPMSSRELSTQADVLSYWKLVLAAPQDTAGLEVRVETGQADRLAPVSKESPSGVYPIKAGSDIDLAVKNTSKVAVTIGVIWYSSTGEVSAVNCWDDRDDPQIQPGTEAYCRVRQDGALEGVELHFITTPAVMPKLVHPPSGGTRGFTSGKPIVVADARQMILRLRFE